MQEDDARLQRSLGRIEGTQDQILEGLKRLDDRLAEHVNADQAAFSGVRVLVNDQRQTIAAQFEEQAKERRERLDAQDEKLEEIMRYINWAKGAAWPVLALLGLLGTILVGVVIERVQAWWTHIR